MLIREVIEKILEYHAVGEIKESCDGYKCGNPDKICTGIVTTCYASVEVIKETIKLSANLIICHEPVFYTHMDECSWLKGDKVYEEKLKLCMDNGIVIWRDHDYIHEQKPDGIFYGVMMELGWEKYLIGERNMPVMFHIPKINIRLLAEMVKQKLGLKGVRIIGNSHMEIENIVMCGHIYTSVPEKRATEILRRNDVDVLIPGELIDWTAAAYARDVAMMGYNKAILQIGHFNSEELGMKYAEKWINDLVENKIQVTFVRSADTCCDIV